MWVRCSAGGDGQRRAAMAPRRPARATLLLLALAGARAWTPVLDKAADFKFGDGAAFWTAGPGCGPAFARALDTAAPNNTAAAASRDSSTCAKPATKDIRSGSPGVDGYATTVKASPTPIMRVTLDFGYIVGFGATATTPPADSPTLAIWVHDTPDWTPTGPGAGKQVYVSPALRCDDSGGGVGSHKGKQDHCYSKCYSKDYKDCYEPGLSVDVHCKGCTGTYLTIKFTNNKNNVQLLLPMDIEINQSTGFISYIIDLSTLAGVVYVMVGVATGAYRGKRGWHIIPHADHARALLGLVYDGVAFSRAKLTGSTSMQNDQTSQGLRAPLAPEKPRKRSSKASVVAAAQKPHAAVRGEQANKLHVAASMGKLSQMQQLQQTDPAMFQTYLNAGDPRQYTPFHVACAGGHADCAQFLLEVGCDHSLTNDTGLDGWELAEQLRRHEVTALRATAPPPPKVKNSGGGATRSRRSSSSSKKSSSGGKKSSRKKKEKSQPQQQKGEGGVTEAEAETEDDKRARRQQVKEHTEQGVHSSQAKTKVMTL